MSACAPSERDEHGEPYEHDDVFGDSKSAGPGAAVAHRL